MDYAARMSEHTFATMRFTVREMHLPTIVRGTQLLELFEQCLLALFLNQY